MASKTISIRKFQSLVWQYYDASGRHSLPWRQTTNPYRILVSEVMLQQTQVDRVIPKYQEFLRTFPTVRALAGASVADVLAAWSGLGYNRRAMLLKRAAEAVVHEHNGRFPREQQALEALPGLGPYTAAAVRAFAWNEPSLCVETNIRSVFIHHFFAGEESVHDRDVEQLVEATLPPGRAREWYAALMDYGTMLKKTHGNSARKSKHYARQSRFEGSNRERRGKIIALLIEKRQRGSDLAKALGMPAEAVEATLGKLVGEGMVEKKGGWYALPAASPKI